MKLRSPRARAPRPSVALLVAATFLLPLASPMTAQVAAVGPISFAEPEFPLDEPFTLLVVDTLDGQPIPPLTLESPVGLAVIPQFLNDLDAVSPMEDPVLISPLAAPLRFDFGGLVSGVSFDAQVFAFDFSQGFPEFLTVDLRLRALDAGGGEVARSTVSVPFDILVDPLEIGQPVSFAAPTRFRALEISVVDLQPGANASVVLDNLAYGVTGDGPFQLGPEVELSPTGSSPATAVDPSGRRAVAWLDGADVRACVYDRNDDAISPVFRVNVVTGAAGLPAVTFDARGNVVFAWQRGTGAGVGVGSPAATSSIAARSFTPQGQAQTAETVVSDSGDAAAPAVDTASGGDPVVTWQGGGKVRGRRLGNGLAGTGPSFEIAAGSGQSAARVALSASGEFAVAWQEQVAGVSAIFVRFFRADGQPKGAALRASAAGAAAATSPAIASDAAGNVAVAWQQQTASDGFDVLVRRFTAAGAPRGDAQRAHAEAAGDQTAPSVAANAAGDFVVAWESSGGAALRRAGGRAGSPAAAGESIVARGFNSQGAGGAQVEVATAEGNTTPAEPQVTVDGGDTITVAFQRKKPNGASAGVFNRRVETALPTTPCVAGPEVLCLNGGRFSVRVSWRDFNGNTGVGRAVPRTSDTGSFWFFSESNVEIVAKVLDATGVNGFFWVFYGALSNVEYTLTVDDSVTGRSTSYFNPLGSFGSVGDTSALPGSVALAPDASRVFGRGSGATLAQGVRKPSALCSNTPSKLCVQQSRFEVTVTWKDFQGQTGSGTAVPLTPDTGYFWFFDDANIELVLKVLDARGVNGRFWVFYGALSNVEYTITVRDTTTDNIKIYTNPLGSFGSVGDTEGLPGN